MKIKSLSILTSVLLVVSLFVYYNENKRGTELIAGSDYIKGLDLAKVYKIELGLEKDKRISLVKDGSRFVLEDYKSYPASILKVNNLIYKLASIQVDKMIVSNASEKDLDEFGLLPGKRKYSIKLFDEAGRKTISFFVGKSYKGRGNFLLKENDKEVYLSKDNLWLSSSYKDFIDYDLLDIEKEGLEFVKLSSSQDLKIMKEGSDFNLFVDEKKVSTKKGKEKLDEYIGSLSSLRFEDFYSVTEPIIQGLKFDKEVKIKFKNNLFYRINVAENDKQYFLKLRAELEEVPTQFVVKKDDSNEELEKIEDIVKAQREAQRLNLEKGTWVYRINELTFNKLFKDKNYFL